MTTEPAYQGALPHILGLRAPWMVKSHQFSPQQRQLDIWIAPAEQQSGWFRASRHVLLAGPEQSWRHLDIAHWHTIVHVVVPRGYTPEGLSCAGDPGQPFSRGMAKFLFELLYNGMELGAICAVYGINLDQLWRFKHALDNGRAGIDAPPLKARAAVAPSSAAAMPEMQTFATLSEPVPDPFDPVWKRLAMGDLDIDIRVLSLKLLLTRVRSQMAVIEDDNVRELKVAELYRYFAKNARTLSHELSQFHEVAR